MLRAKTFTVKTRSGIYVGLIPFVVINIIVLFYISLELLLVLVVFDLVYLWILFEFPVATIAEINSEKLIISKRFFLKRETKNEFDLSMVDFSYRSVNISRHTSTRRNVLTVYHNEQFVFDLEPGENGWDGKDILDVITFFKKIGLKQVIKKYSDNEIKV